MMLALARVERNIKNAVCNTDCEIKTNYIKEHRL